MIWRTLALAVSVVVFWIVFDLARASEDYPKRAGGIAFMAGIGTLTVLWMMAKQWERRRGG